MLTLVMQADRPPWVGTVEEEVQVIQEKHIRDKYVVVDIPCFIEKVPCVRTAATKEPRAAKCNELDSMQMSLHLYFL
jgi:hypothetical protein